MENHFLAASNDVKKLCKKYVGKPVSKEISDSLAKDISDYIFPVDAISIEIRKSAKGKYHVHPANLYTFLALKGIVLPYQLVEGRDSIQIEDRVFSFINGKCSITTI